jgi:predicted MFS family arabinose efflux permease
LASTSITSIIMIGNAFGSATGGLVTNLAGMATTPASAAFLLYAIFACAPLAAAFATRRLK